MPFLLSAVLALVILIPDKYRSAAKDLALLVTARVSVAICFLVPRQIAAPPCSNSRFHVVRTAGARKDESLVTARNAATLGPAILRTGMTGCLLVCPPERSPCACHPELAKDLAFLVTTRNKSIPKGHFVSIFRYAEIASVAGAPSQ